MAAERGERALLQHLEQLDLHRDRHLADLVQEQRAVGAAALEDALMVVDGAGEGTLAVAEQLGFDQRLGKLRQVDRDEAVGEVGDEAPLGRRVGNERGPPDRGRCRSLAGAGLAEDQRGEILHPAQQRGVVAAHVVGEHVVPQRLA